MPTLKELVDCMPAFVESSQTLQATLGGEKVGFKKGDHLVLICVHEVKKLRAEDEKDPNITYFLPLTSKKTFERLPTGKSSSSACSVDGDLENEKKNSPIDRHFPKGELESRCSM